MPNLFQDWLRRQLANMAPAPMGRIGDPGPGAPGSRYAYRTPPFVPENNGGGYLRNLLLPTPDPRAPRVDPTLPQPADAPTGGVALTRDQAPMPGAGGVLRDIDPSVRQEEGRTGAAPIDGGSERARLRDLISQEPRRSDFPERPVGIGGKLGAGLKSVASGLLTGPEGVREAWNRQVHPERQQFAEAQQDYEQQFGRGKILSDLERQGEQDTQARETFDLNRRKSLRDLDAPVSLEDQYAAAVASGDQTKAQRLAQAIQNKSTTRQPTRLITTTGAGGQPEQRIVPDEPGATFPTVSQGEPGLSEFERAFKRGKGRLPTASELEAHQRQTRAQTSEESDEAVSTLADAVISGELPITRISQRDLPAVLQEVDRRGEIILTPKLRADAQKLADMEQTILKLEDLHQRIAPYKSGIAARTSGVTRTMAKWAGYDADARELDTLKADLGPIARSISREVGVLTNPDISRAEVLVPNISDTDEEWTRKLNQIRRAIDAGYQTIQKVAGQPASTALRPAAKKQGAAAGSEATLKNKGRVLVEGQDF